MIGKLIIFDFDGVLADSFDTFFPLIRDAMKNVNIDLTENQYRDLFIGNVHKGFRDLIKDNEKYSAFLEFRKTNYDKYYYGKNKVKLFPGTVDFVKKVGKKHILAVASSGKQDNIEGLLEENGVRNLFGLVLADTATTKEGMIKKILNEFRSEPKNAVMITDTVGDIKAAKKCGLKTVAVTWGFHSRTMLRTARPNFIVSTLEELSKILIN